MSGGPPAAAPSSTRTWIPAAALVAITAVWGSTFVVVKDAIARMPVLDFLAWRFAVAALVMLLVRPRAVAHLGRRGRGVGALLGVALGIGYIAQTLGLRTTPASVSGFITGMFVVFTPLCAGVLLHRRVGAAAWVAVVVATVGLGLLSLHGGLAISGGAALTLLCALAFALHIVGLGEWSPSYDAVGLAVVQLAVVAALCAAAGVTSGGLAPPPAAAVWLAVVGTAVAATAVAFFVQTWAQARIAPTRAAVIMTMEPVFAGIFGVWVAGDRFGLRELAGALLVLTAMLLVEIGPRRGAEGEVERLEV